MLNYKLKLVLNLDTTYINSYLHNINSIPTSYILTKTQPLFNTL